MTIGDEMPTISRRQWRSAVTEDESSAQGPCVSIHLFSCLHIHHHHHSPPGI
jgi:hypothetical protein